MSDEKEKTVEPEVIDGKVSSEERQLAMLAHLLAILAGFIAPLIIYLVKKEESEFIDDQAKESLNFQITIFIVSMIVGLFSFITCGITTVLIPVILVVDIIFCIIAGIKANEGVRYRYPVNIRIVK